MHWPTIFTTNASLTSDKERCVPTDLIYPFATAAYSLCIRWEKINVCLTSAWYRMTVDSFKWSLAQHINPAQDERNNKKRKKPHTTRNGSRVMTQCPVKCEIDVYEILLKRFLNRRCARRESLIIAKIPRSLANVQFFYQLHRSFPRMQIKFAPLHPDTFISTRSPQAIQKISTRNLTFIGKTRSTHNQRRTIHYKPRRYVISHSVSRNIYITR